MFKRKTRVFKAGTNLEGTFGNQRHTAWHEFENSIASGHFDRTLKGTLFPKRSDLTKTLSGEQELSAWESTARDASVFGKKNHRR